MWTFKIRFSDLNSLSRQCKGCRTGESLRRQGAAQRGGTYTAVDTAQSQERHWPTGQSRRRHDPGLAPDWLRAHAHFHSALAQRQHIRTHLTASRCSLVLRHIEFLLSRSLLGKGDLQLYSMAPSKKMASSKGKTGMYLCPACEHRHAPPTGIQCPHVQQPRSTPLEATARSQTAGLPAGSHPLLGWEWRLPAMQWKDQTLPSTLHRTWLVIGRWTLSGHVCHSTHHFGGTQRSTRGGSGSTFSSTTGKVDTSCPTTSVHPCSGRLYIPSSLT